MQSGDAGSETSPNTPEKVSQVALKSVFVLTTRRFAVFLFPYLFWNKSHLSPCFVVPGGQTGTSGRAEGLPGQTPRAS